MLHGFETAVLRLQSCTALWMLLAPVCTAACDVPDQPTRAKAEERSSAMCNMQDER